MSLFVYIRPSVCLSVQLIISSAYQFFPFLPFYYLQPIHWIFSPHELNSNDISESHFFPWMKINGNWENFPSKGRGKKGRPGPGPLDIWSEFWILALIYRFDDNLKRVDNRPTRRGYLQNNRSLHLWTDYGPMCSGDNNNKHTYGVGRHPAPLRSCVWIQIKAPLNWKMKTLPQIQPTGRGYLYQINGWLNFSSLKPHARFSIVWKKKHYICKASFHVPTPTIIRH